MKAGKDSHGPQWFLEEGGLVPYGFATVPGKLPDTVKRSVFEAVDFFKLHLAILSRDHPRKIV